MSNALSTRPILDQVAHWQSVRDENDMKDRGWSKEKDERAREAIAELYKDGFEDLLGVMKDLAEMDLPVGVAVKVRAAVARMGGR